MVPALPASHTWQVVALATGGGPAIPQIGSGSASASACLTGFRVRDATGRIVPIIAHRCGDSAVGYPDRGNEPDEEQSPTVISWVPPGAVCPGGEAEFQFAAGFTSPGVYTWLKDEAVVWQEAGIGGAPSFLVIPSAGPEMLGIYRCIFTNAGGSVSSPSHELSICSADFNCSGTLTVQDIFDFLAAYFGNDSRGDFNSSGGITVQDIFDFLAAYFAGCA